MAAPSGGRRPTGSWRGRTFASLIASSNYRRFVVGQSISLVGTWMQMIGQSWLVLQLTGSATTLGIVAAVQTLPILLLSPYAGVLVDRRGKRRVLLITQMVMALLALTLGLLTLTHAVRLWMVMVIAGGLGLATCVDNPARQAFVPEIVGTDLVANAISLNSAMVNAARAVGPALGGVLIVSVGVAACFLFNTVSFVAVIIAPGHDEAGTAPPCGHVHTRAGAAARRLALRATHSAATDPPADDGSDRGAVV